MKLITLHLPEHYISELDDLVDRGFYPNRAEAIRFAIRDLLCAERHYPTLSNALSGALGGLTNLDSQC